MPRFSLKTLLVASTAIAILIGAAVWLDKYLDPFIQRTFRAASWAKCDRQDRAWMARDLIRHHLSVGMSAVQVKALLGPPDGVLSPNYVPGSTVRAAETYSYSLGNWSWEGFDDAFLYVHFN